MKLRALFSLIFTQLSCLSVVEPYSNNLLNCFYIPLLPILPDISQTKIVISSLKLAAHLSNNTLLLVILPHLRNKTSILYYKMQHLTSPTFPFCYIISCTPGNPWHFLTAFPLNPINPITHSPYFHPIHQVNPHNISYIFSTILTCIFDVLPRYLSIAHKVSLHFGILLCFQTLYPVCKLVFLIHHVHLLTTHI